MWVQSGGGWSVDWSAVCLPFIVSASAGLQASGPEECRLWSSGGVCSSFCAVFLAFCLPYRLVSGWSLANMALFRILRAFLAWFGAVVWVCVVLVLCVACVVFVRVWS